MDSNELLSHLFDGVDGSFEEYLHTSEIDEVPLQHKRNIRQLIETYYDSKRLRVILKDPLYESENVEEEELCGD